MSTIKLMKSIYISCDLLTDMYFCRFFISTANLPAMCLKQCGVLNGPNLVQESGTMLRPEPGEESFVLFHTHEREKRSNGEECIIRIQNMLEFPHHTSKGR